MAAKKKGSTKTRKKTGKKLIVSDFDDTMFFTENSMAFAAMELLGMPLSRASVRKLDKSVKSKVYDLAYSKYKDSMEPNVRLIMKYRKMQREGYELMIFSAKGDSMRKEVEHSLAVYGIKHDKMVLQDGRNRIEDSEWKAGEIAKHIDGYDEVLLFEDKTGNIETIKGRVKDDRVRYFLVDRRGEREITE